MPEPDNVSFAAIVQNNIQHLKQHPHVQEIIPIRPLVYKVVYWPQDLDSLYSQMVYNLKLTIPQSFPQRPPHLVFLDKIYHLNVHPKSGQVFMSILMDDWSPFLNLKSVISSLDEVLQEPDENNPATKEILQQYQQDINTYVQNVKAILEQNARQTELQLKNDNGESAQEIEEVVEQVIEVKDFNYDQIKKNIVEQNTLIHDQPSQNNLNIKIGNLKRRQYSFTSSHDVEQSPRSTKGQKRSTPVNSPRQNSKGQQSQKKFASRKDPSADQESYAQYEAIIKDSKVILNNPNQSGSSFDGLKLNMLRCKELIKIFSEELSELQQSLQKPSGSKRLKKLFEDRCAKVETIIVELFDIREKIQFKLMDTVKKDFNKYK